MASQSQPRPSINDLFTAACHEEEAGEKYRALAIYEEILLINPEHAASHLNMGTIYFHLGHFNSAEESYRRAALIDPEYALAFFNLGNALDELGRDDDAIVAYERAVEIDPEMADAHFNLALMLEERGLKTAARHHWKVYLKLAPNDPWAGMILNLLKKKNGQK